MHKVHYPIRGDGCPPPLPPRCIFPGLFRTCALKRKQKRDKFSTYCISQNFIKNQQENQGQVPKLKYPQKQKWPGNEYYIENGRQYEYSCFWIRIRYKLSLITIYVFWIIDSDGKAAWWRTIYGWGSNPQQPVPFKYLSYSMHVETLLSSLLFNWLLRATHNIN